MQLQIRKIDRGTGSDCGTISLDEAVARISNYFDGMDKKGIRDSLLEGQPFRTVAYHYEITPESLAAYRQGKLECAYDRLAMNS